MSVLYAPAKSVLGAPCLVLFESLSVLLLAVYVLMVLRFMLGVSPLGVL